MKLEFSLLVVDDAPENIGSAIDILRDHLKEKGFTLIHREVTDFSKENLRGIMRMEGRNYDLVMVDYNLGQEKTNGAEIARQLRSGLSYTDMVFYSSISEPELLGKLARLEVPGVFAAERGVLDSALTGLADTVIGKAVDLNHMRGIAMAEVAEMDLLMVETLGRVFQSTENRVNEVRIRTIKKLREGIKENEKLLEKTYENLGLGGVVANSLLFSSTSKYRTLKRIAKCLSEKPIEALLELEFYETDVIQKRNMLAHVKESSREDGSTILRSIGGDGREVVIDDDWMTNFRRKLMQCGKALIEVCNALDSQFGTTDTG